MLVTVPLARVLRECARLIVVISGGSSAELGIVRRDISEGEERRPGKWETGRGGDERRKVPRLMMS